MPCLHSKKPKGRGVLCSIQSGPGLQNSARLKCYIPLSQLSFQVASFCHRTAVAAPGFTFWLLLLKGIRGAPFHHHLLRVKTFPGGSPFLNASLWVSWAWMVSQCPPERWPGGGIAIIRGQLRSTLKPRLPCQMDSPFTRLGDWRSTRVCWMPTSPCWNAYTTSRLPLSTGTRSLPGLNSDTAPAGHSTRLLQKLERLWILSMGPLRAPMSLSPSSGSDTPALHHPTETDCLPSDSLFQQELKPCSDATFIAVYLKKQVDMTNSCAQS